MDCQIRYHSAADPVNRSLLNYALLKSFLVHLPIVLSGFTSIKSNLMSTNGHIIDLKANRKIIGIVLPLSRYIPFLESIIKESQYVNTITQVKMSSASWCLAYVGNKKIHNKNNKHRSNTFSFSLPQKKGGENFA